MEIKKIYKESSGVNIDFVHDKYDWERAIGYEGEFELFKYLLNNDSFKYSKLLTNLVIPSGNGNSTTEIDMVLITQYGIIVFEVKNYKGTIYGKPGERYWTQYFKTIENNKFSNPIRQNMYHINALKKLCSQKMFSIIFFSNPLCNIDRVETFNDNCAVVNRQTLPNILYELSQASPILNENEINNIFDKLKDYSNLTITQESYASSEINDFHDFLKQSQEYLDKEVENRSAKYKKIFIKKAEIISTISAIVVILCLYSCLVFYEERNEAITMRDEATAQYNIMNEIFSVVSESDIALSQSLLKVTDTSITRHDYLDGSYLSFVINNTSKTAYISANSNQPRILVTLKDGSVQEYSLQKTFYSIYPGKQQEYTVSLSCKKDEIKYIKMETLYVLNNGTYSHPFSINIYEQ